MGKFCFNEKGWRWAYSGSPISASARPTAMTIAAVLRQS
jgi:hypothetical protein